MEKLMIINGSPRAAKSNSKQYAALFSQHCPIQTEYFNITQTNHLDLCQAMNRFSQVIFVFPLYVDSLPVTLLNFLKTLEENLPKYKPTISVLINCGFIEPEQNDIAIKIIQLFCRQVGCPFGSVLKIGGGEAILTTPFRFLVVRKIKHFAISVSRKQNKTFKVTMPLPKKIFIKASTNYWENYGKRHGITKEQMSTMQIESPELP